ncbi:hypothetical protein GCM10010452_62520 [Crossiella cryophila]
MPVLVDSGNRAHAEFMNLRKAMAFGVITLAAATLFAPSAMANQNTGTVNYPGGNRLEVDPVLLLEWLR